jgi:hypothetical protein
MQLRAIIAAIIVASTVVPARAEIVNATSYQRVDNYTGEVAYFIDVTITVDSLEIDGISVNRGNCSWYGLQVASLPVIAKFGQSFTIRTNCSPLELLISSKGGNGVIVRWH